MLTPADKVVISTLEQTIADWRKELHNAQVKLADEQAAVSARVQQVKLIEVNIQILESFVEKLEPKK